ncbi:glycoside hydrolase family 3 C-terminal domain-containing protein, partial [Streptomyces mirabilis]
ATRAQDVAEAVDAARAAHSVVLFAYEDATEGLDRGTLALPGNQERLIRAVAAANPRTAVVLNTSSSTSMPWLDGTGAVLQMYYPGQEGAAATAAVLFGDCDPGGRLTQSFAVDDAHHPVAGDPHRYPGVNGAEEYSEGIHVGYRWYDAQGVRPLFPFGHGLSYTSFAYEDLPSVFDRFWRAEKSRSRRTGGSGLGLSIVRQLVAAHGGTVAVASELGAGSVFTLRLPATDPPVDGDEVR